MMVGFISIILMELGFVGAILSPAANSRATVWLLASLVTFMLGLVVFLADKARKEK